MLFPVQGIFSKVDKKPVGAMAFDKMLSGQTGLAAGCSEHPVKEAVMKMLMMTPMASTIKLFYSCNVILHFINVKKIIPRFTLT